MRGVEGRAAESGGVDRRIARLARPIGDSNILSNTGPGEMTDKPAVRHPTEFSGVVLRQSSPGEPEPFPP